MGRGYLEKVVSALLFLFSRQNLILLVHSKPYLYMKHFNNQQFNNRRTTNEENMKRKYYIPPQTNIGGGSLAGAILVIIEGIATLIKFILGSLPSKENRQPKDKQKGK